MNEKLMNIQQELKCNKGQYNSFGKYKYRSCEDILESVKPLLKKHKCILTINDELLVFGDNNAIHYEETYYDKELKDENTRHVIAGGQRFYIKATATITDIEKGESISNTAYAREEEDKKGMDGSQITGTASSYARKYALNGLFAIDDTKDADTDEYANQTKSKTTTNKTTTKKDTTDYRKKLITHCNQTDLDMNEIAKEYKLNSKSTQEEFKIVLDKLGVK